MAGGGRTGETRILMGRIGAAHGIGGAVRVLAFTDDPLAIAAYGPLDTDRPGLTVTLTKARLAGKLVIASVEGVGDRNAAERLNGVSLYIDRARLPQTDDDEFYHADLVGLTVRTRAGEGLGTVTGVENFGAGDLLDIDRGAGRKSVYLPFTRAVVPEIHVAEGYLVAVPPQGWLEDAAAEDGS